VLIYKSSSVPNLAQGAMWAGGLRLLRSQPGGLPLWLAIPARHRTSSASGSHRAQGRCAVAGRPIIRSDDTLGLEISCATAR